MRVEQGDGGEDGDETQPVDDEERAEIVEAREAGLRAGRWG